MTTAKKPFGKPDKDAGLFASTSGFPDAPDEPAIPSGREQKLHMFFDDELDEGESKEFARELDRDPELRHHLEQMGTMRQLVSRSLEVRATDVPRARFEQIWDAIDRSLDAEERAARAPAPASIWSRLWEASRPYRVPVIAAVGAAAVAVAVVQFTGSGGVNEEPSIASVPELPPTQAAPTPDRPDQAIAKRTPEPPAQPDVFPTPKTGEAEIHGVEFGGKVGRISQTGTVTVLYVEEDDTPQKSERSL